MKRELEYYEIFPKVLRAEEKSSITLRPLGKHMEFDAEAEYLVRFMPMDEGLEPLDDTFYESVKVKPEDGMLKFEHVFRGEQEHYIRVFKMPDTKKVIGNFSVYSLHPDLFIRRPYRGDFHVHTHYSDGKESPAIVAANYRKQGFDFLAITDHRRWFPSIEAIKAFEGIPVDLKLFPGEEVHPPDNHIHIVNFGGRFSLNEMFQKEREIYDREVNEIMNSVTVPEGVNLKEYASCVWCFDRIREGGGLGIFCHPHWISNVYHVPEKMIDFLFENKPFDAFEVLGGQEVFSNNLQIAYYNEARAKGMKIPIVGASDSHGTVNSPWFNWLYSIVFSEDLELVSICNSVKEMYSVAVENYPNEAFRVTGPYRFVKYARFLMEEYFPLHDELCFEEGRLMKEYVCGNDEAVEILELLKGRTAALMKRCFAE